MALESSEGEVRIDDDWVIDKILRYIYRFLKITVKLPG